MILNEGKHKSLITLYLFKATQHLQTSAFFHRLSVVSMKQDFSNGVETMEAKENCKVKPYTSKEVSEFFKIANSYIFPELRPWCV